MFNCSTRYVPVLGMVYPGYPRFSFHNGLILSNVVHCEKLMYECQNFTIPQKIWICMTGDIFNTWSLCFIMVKHTTQNQTHDTQGLKYLNRDILVLQLNMF